MLNSMFQPCSESRRRNRFRFVESDHSAIPSLSQVDGRLWWRPVSKCTWTVSLRFRSSASHSPYTELVTEISSALG